MRAEVFLLINGPEADILMWNNNKLIKLGNAGLQELLSAELGFQEELKAFWRNVVYGEASLAGLQQTLELWNLIESIYQSAIKRIAIEVPKAKL